MEDDSRCWVPRREGCSPTTAGTVPWTSSRRWAPPTAKHRSRLASPVSFPCTGSEPKTYIRVLVPLGGVVLRGRARPLGGGGGGLLQAVGLLLGAAGGVGLHRVNQDAADGRSGRRRAATGICIERRGSDAFRVHWEISVIQKMRNWAQEMM